MALSKNIRLQKEWQNTARKLKKAEAVMFLGSVSRFLSYPIFYVILNLKLQSTNNMMVMKFAV